jgi:hypothetical protein
MENNSKTENLRPNSNITEDTAGNQVLETISHVRADLFFSSQAFVFESLIGNFWRRQKNFQ